MLDFRPCFSSLHLFRGNNPGAALASLIVGVRQLYGRTGERWHIGLDVGVQLCPNAVRARIVRMLDYDYLELR